MNQFRYREWIIYCPIFFAILSVSIIASLRGPEIGSDTSSYINFYKIISTGQSSRIDEPLFIFSAKVVSFFSGSYHFWFFLITFVALCFLFVFLRSVSRRNFKEAPTSRIAGIATISFSLIILSPFFESAFVNVMRQGVSLPFLYFGFFLIFAKKFLWGTSSFLVALAIHKSVIVFLPFIPLLFFGIKLQLTFITTFSLLYVCGFSEVLVRVLLNFFGLRGVLDLILDYGEGVAYRAGVRIDFLAFSLFVYILFYLGELKERRGMFLTRMASVLMAPFLTIGFIPFSDRLLLPLWFLSPVACALFFRVLFRRLKIPQLFFLAQMLLVTSSVFFSIMFLTL